MEKIFTDIYAQDTWNGGSGPGSTAEFCAPLVTFLCGYFQDLRLNSLCDLGCGDMQWIPQLVETVKLRYTGVDCVPSLIARHRATYPQPRYTFKLGDVSQMAIAEVPEADVYLLKDVLQHWESHYIRQFLSEFFRARPRAHLLTVNCNRQTTDERKLDAKYHFAPLHGAYMPLKLFRPDTLLTWGGKTLYRLQPPAPLER